MMVGHQFLKKEFNVTPKMSWNLEAMGSSLTTARLMAQQGMEAHLLLNIDFDVKNTMKKNQTDGKRDAEFYWNPSKSNYGDKYKLFTSVWMHQDFWYPDGMNHDVNPRSGKGDQPIIVDAER
jgi:hypothetical protein